jgi:hypothetical protein
MNTPIAPKPLRGSERPRPDSHTPGGPVDPGEKVAVTLLLRRKPGAPPLPDLAHWHNTPFAKRRFLSVDEYVDAHGAGQADLDTVAAFVRAQGMSLLDSHAGRRTVSVLGTAAQMNAAFGVMLHRYDDPHAPRLPTGPHDAHAGSNPTMRTHRGFDGAVYLPAELDGVVEAVIGFDDRFLGTPHGALGDPAGTGYPLVPIGAQRYNFPNSGAADQTIGIFAPQAKGAPGTPPCYLPSDINTQYFSTTNLPAGYQTAPLAIVDVNVAVGTTTYLNNQSQVTGVTSPQTANNAILELTQDISTSATIAQGATINVYFTEATEQGHVVFLKRVLVPVTENRPTVLSFSFGIYLGDDASGGPAYTGIGSLTDTNSAAYAIDQLLQEVAAVGISVFIALGDWGADNWSLLAAPNNVPPDGNQHVAFPGSDPYVTACGGTLLGSTQEVVWSDAFSTTSPFGGSFVGQQTNSNFGATGGGVSATFLAPPYQTAAGITGATDSVPKTHAGRGVPDVAGHVAYSGFFVNGLSYSYVGTSCVAPLYAGLAAVLRSALGQALGPMNDLFYALKDVAFNDITQGNNSSNDTPANDAITISGYSGGVANAPFFSAGTKWDACSGLGSIDGTKLLNGLGALLYNQTFYFQVNKGSFGLDEVNITADYASPAPMSLVVEGFTPNAVQNAVTSGALGLTITASIPGVTVTAGAMQPEIATALDTPQRVYFPCAVKFAPAAIATIGTGQGIFPLPGTPPTPTQVLLTTQSPLIGGQFLPAAETVLTLNPGADPYFSNFATNGNFALSEDLRVFTVTPGINKAPINGVPLNAPDLVNFHASAGYGYIQALLASLNKAPFNLPTGTDPFTLFPDQTDALSGDSSVTPTSLNPANSNATPFANYNFAVAKVRLDGAPNTSSGANVRVLFRVFAAQTSDTDFQTNTYPSTNDNEGQPLAPLLGADNVTIPFFATGNYQSNADFGVNADYQKNNAAVNSINNQPVAIGSSGQVWAYYGCYLNIYPTGNTIDLGPPLGKVAVQTLLPSTHSCLVAQLIYDDAPAPSGPGVLQGPEWSSNFAQRNLQITYSDNPGPAAAHRIPQTFDARPSPAPGTGPLEDYPDEFLIEWGDTPVGSIASIYWPAVAAADVLALAKQIYATHQLSAADAHTIQCTVPRGFTGVPIPAGTGANFAGLFTIDLPQGVTAGEAFTVTVQRVSTYRSAPPRPPSQIDGVAESTAATAREPLRNWRYIVGTFTVRIPVTTKHVMLPAEENTLAILRWRLSQMAPSNRWVPVLERYLGVVEGRVRGLGGNPASIKPSSWGTFGPPRLIGKGPGQGNQSGHEHRHAATGKVDGVVYDRFGDFEGFHLLTEEGHERIYYGREAEIEALARYAWVERVVITVLSEAHRPDRPVNIILRRAPQQPSRPWP